VQDALLAAYKHVDQFKGEAQMSTWLTVIVTNCARMQLRRRPRQAHLSLDEQSQGERECSWSEHWRTVDQVLKMSVGSPNCVGISCNSQRSFRRRCAKHSSCVTWLG
jgi:hypothetical protein